MTRNRKKPAHKKHAGDLPLREDQKIALIPGGPVSAQRGRRDDIDLEVRGTTAKGAPIIMGQVVSTLVRKLLAQEAITLEEASAAWLYEHDYDVAYRSGKNILASLVVDGGGKGGADAAMNRKAYHGNRFRQANARLGAEHSAIATSSILRGANFSALGADLFPNATQTERAIAGKAVFVLTLRNLAEIYGKRNPRKTNILIEE